MKFNLKYLIYTIISLAIVWGMLTLIGTAIIKMNKEAIRDIRAAGFGIYLLENNELILSDSDIKAYEINEPYGDAIILNEQGIGKLTPIEEDLAGKEFVAMIGDKEIYRGIFLSLFSSQWPTPPGAVAIYLPTMDYGQDEKKLPVGLGPKQIGQDPRHNEELMNYFLGKGALKKTKDSAQ